MSLVDSISNYLLLPGKPFYLNKYTLVISSGFDILPKLMDNYLVPTVKRICTKHKKGNYKYGCYWRIDHSRNRRRIDVFR